LKIYDGAVHILGGVDVLVNNAGVYAWSPVEKTPPDKVDELLKVNLQTPYELCRLAVPAMKAQRYGRIINIGSISGAVGEANASLYSMTKAGLIGMTKALALELAEWGITVNTINPGWVKTELAQSALAENGFDEQEEIDMVPQKRWIEPAEVASLVEYLISDAACGITGQSINLCCGLSLG
jgi:NAD(P)-dependent dehydrogenase (short-subunit alcohol dehydrogenase family)